MTEDAGSTWIYGRTTIPRPSATTHVDYERSEIISSIIALGAGADARLRELHQRTGTEDGGKFVDLVKPGEAAFTYLPLRLGDIRGYKTILNLYGYGDDHRLAADVEDAVRNAGGIIVVQGQADDASNVMRAARSVLASGRGVPCAVLGADSLADAWRTASGISPLFRASLPTEENFSSALKNVTKEILSSLRTHPSSPPAPLPKPPKPWWRFW